MLGYIFLIVVLFIFLKEHFAREAKREQYYADCYRLGIKPEWRG